VGSVGRIMLFEYMQMWKRVNIGANVSSGNILVHCFCLYHHVMLHDIHCCM
jgi:hypothetical protein